MSTQTPTRRKPAKKQGGAKAQPIDPRIRDRRIEVLRMQGRRRLRWTIGLIVVGAVVAAAWLLTHSSLLDVGPIRVTGAQQAAPRAGQRAARRGRGGPSPLLHT